MSIYSFQLNASEGLNEAQWPAEMFKFIQKFSVYSIKNGEVLEVTTNKNEEIGLLILEGSCDLSIEGKVYQDVGLRKSVFSGLPFAVYVPVDTKLTLTSKGVTIGVCVGKCAKKTQHALIRPEDIKQTKVGKDNWQRDVRIIIGPEAPSVNLILGETLNPPGNWSGTPAHRHQSQDLPRESLHEELYYFKVDKPQGFGIEKFYSPERNIEELIALKEGMVTYMPWGYHQIVAGAGYTLYYLFFLAGEGKQLAAMADSNHDWITK